MVNFWREINVIFLLIISVGKSHIMMVQKLWGYNNLSHSKFLEIFVTNLYSLYDYHSLVSFRYFSSRSIPPFCIYSQNNSIQRHFYDANLSRVVPSDFEQDVQKSIEGLLFRASFSNSSLSDNTVLNDLKLSTGLEIFKNDLNDMESPVFNLLSPSDVILARTKALDNIKPLLQMPKILHPRKPPTLRSNQNIHTNTGSLLDYDASPLVFLNVTSALNKSSKILNQLCIEEFILKLNACYLSYPMVLYREIDGELRIAKGVEIDRLLQVT